MKNYLLLLLIAFASCSKSNDAFVPPVSYATTVKITGATQKDYSGVTMLELTVDLENSVNVSVCELRIYKTDANSEEYVYSLELKDGVQIVVCPKYTSTSPLMYQLRQKDKVSGAVTFSAMLSKSYN